MYLGLGLYIKFFFLHLRSHHDLFNAINLEGNKLKKKKSQARPFTHPAGDPSLQVTESFFKNFSLMSSSSFCEEHVYNDCARFSSWAKKSSAFAFTGVKSSGMLSAPLGGCRRARRVWAGAPGPLFASTGAPRWMKSNSRQERTGDTPERLITPRIHTSTRKKYRFFKKKRERERNLEKYQEGCRRSAGQGSPWSSWNCCSLTQTRIPSAARSHSRMAHGSSQSAGSSSGSWDQMVFYLETHHASFSTQVFSH